MVIPGGPGGQGGELPTPGAPMTRRVGTSVDVGEPLRVARLLAPDGAEVHLLHEGADGAGLAGADGAVVHLAHGGDFRRGAGEEDLIGDVERVAREGDLLHGAAAVAQNLQDGVAGDAVEDGRG